MMINKGLTSQFFSNYYGCFSTKLFTLKLGSRALYSGGPHYFLQNNKWLPFSDFIRKYSYDRNNLPRISASPKRRLN